MKKEKPSKKEYNFTGDYFTSEILCNLCDYGKSQKCDAEPPCKTYQAVEDNREL